MRSHRAFGGTQIAFVGHERPWQFKESTQAFSRRLESQLDVVYLPDDDALLEWSVVGLYRDGEVIGSSAVGTRMGTRVPGFASVQNPTHALLGFNRWRLADPTDFSLVS